MSRGQLVPDDTIVRVFLDRLEQPDAASGAVLDGFPRTRVQAEALDAELAGAGRQVDRAILIDVPTEELVARMANRWICAANGHVYNLTSNPPLQPGICDIDGAPLTQREDDQEETVRARLEPADPAAPRRHRPLPQDAASSRSVDGRLPIDEVSAGVLAALDEPAGSRRRRRLMVTRKSKRRDREDAPRRPDRRRGPRAGRVASCKPGVSTGHLDRLAERHIRAPGARARRSRATGHRRNPFPASLCISIDDEVVHGIPGDRTIRGRPDRVGRRRRDLRRLARRRGADVLRRRAPSPRSRAARRRRPAWR